MSVAAFSTEARHNVKAAKLQKLMNSEEETNEVSLLVRSLGLLVAKIVSRRAREPSIIIGGCILSSLLYFGYILIQRMFAVIMQDTGLHAVLYMCGRWYGVNPKY